MTALIGVSTEPKLVETAAGEIDAHTIADTYTSSVLRAGGVPVLLPPVPTRDIPLIFDRIDGLVLTGGGDMEAHRYGAEEHETMNRMDFDRDEFEIELAREAHRRRFPVLAICRGLQVVNVAFGGSLVQDIPSELGSMDHTVFGHAVYDGHQPIKIDPGCAVAAVVNDTELMVNSVHHQAVQDLAPGFRAVAWAADGIVEAIEHEDETWPLLAVQWHPEYLGDRDDAASHALFAALVEAAEVG
jgi:putative glutamine amidotransferase